MNATVHRWSPLPLDRALDRWQRASATLPDPPVLRRQVAHGATWDVAWAGGRVRVSLSAWGGGTSIETVPLDVAPRAAARLLARISDGLDATPDRCHRRRWSPAPLPAPRPAGQPTTT